MKRLHNYLLTHHPLLWNMRVHIMLPALLLLNLLFFVAGWSSISLPESLRWSALRAGSGVVSLAILCAILAGVLWLIFYLRNNAFKSFYPLKRGHLVAEAGLILLTCLLLTTPGFFYTAGTYSRMRQLTATTDLAHEMNTANLAAHFLPFSRASFSSSNDCANRTDDDEDRTYPMSSTAVDTATMGSAVDTFSYLHFCYNEVFDKDVAGLRSARGNDSIAKRWLLAGRQDSVRRLLQEYLALCSKYGGGHRFDADRHVKEIFSRPGFPVRYEISNGAYAGYETSPDGTSLPAGKLRDTYIESGHLSEALRTIAEARQGWLDTGTIFFLLYWSLGMALLLFSFRITAVRPWFIALIGAGVWCAVFGVLGAFMGRAASGYGLAFLFVFLAIGFLITATVLINRREQKRNAGVSLLWAMWSLPAIVPTICSWIEHLYAPRYYDTGSPNVSPVYEWIRDSWPLIGYTNFVLYLLLLIVLFIPLARKWQAMPEE